MRYMLAGLLALGLGVATVLPAAFAAGEENGHDLGSGGTVTVQTDQGNPGTVAGPDAPTVNEHETDRN